MEDQQKSFLKIEFNVIQAFFVKHKLVLAESQTFLEWTDKPRLQCGFHFKLVNDEDLVLKVSTIRSITVSPSGMCLHLQPHAYGRFRSFFKNESLDDMMESDFKIPQGLIVRLQPFNTNALVKVYKTNGGHFEADVNGLENILKPLQKFRDSELHRLQAHPLSYVHKSAIEGEPKFIERINPEDFNSLIERLGLVFNDRQERGELNNAFKGLHLVASRNDFLIESARGDELKVEPKRIQQQVVLGGAGDYNGHIAPAEVVKGGEEEEATVGVEALLSLKGAEVMKEELEEPTSFVVMEPRLRKNSSPIEAIQDSITLCTFPVGKDGVDVHIRDMVRFAYGEMLSDTNIEFGCKYILKKRHPDFDATCYLFNTYFWSNLTADHIAIQQQYANDSVRKSWIKSNYARVKRWTRKVDIFSKKHLVIPVNDELHWCMIILRNPGALITHKDDVNSFENEDDDPEKHCLYIILDSIPESDEKRKHGVAILLDYLECEFEDKKRKTYPNHIINRNKMRKVVNLHNPVQKNFIDCGIYLLAFFEQYAEKVPNFTRDLTLDWTVYSPFFESINIKYYRERLIRFAKSQTPRDRWSLLERFERRRYGVINQSEHCRLEIAKKTRSHSYCYADWLRVSKEIELKRSGRKRPRSLPPRLDGLISTKPIVILRSAGRPATSRI